MRSADIGAKVHLCRESLSVCEEGVCSLQSAVMLMGEGGAGGGVTAKEGDEEQQSLCRFTLITASLWWGGHHQIAIARKNQREVSCLRRFIHRITRGGKGTAEEYALAAGSSIGSM